jgi:hypothetical protein
MDNLGVTTIVLKGVRLQRTRPPHCVLSLEWVSKSGQLLMKSDERVSTVRVVLGERLSIKA